MFYFSLKSLLRTAVFKGFAREDESVNKESWSKQRCYCSSISMRPNFQPEWMFFNTDPLKLIMCLNVHYYCTCFQLCFTPKQKKTYVGLQYLLC